MLNDARQGKPRNRPSFRQILLHLDIASADVLGAPQETYFKSQVCTTTETHKQITLYKWILYTFLMIHLVWYEAYYATSRSLFAQDNIDFSVLIAVWIVSIFDFFHSYYRLNGERKWRNILRRSKVKAPVSTGLMKSWSDAGGMNSGVWAERTWGRRSEEHKMIVNVFSTCEWWHALCLPVRDKWTNAVAPPFD